MNRSFWKLTALITLGVVAALAAINWRFYFDTPFFEQGDIAANALQIHHAKHLAEIYGNYSRYNFNHPGPAFFYVYALGERVLRDWLGVVPSAHNAHSLAGLMLQAFFFAAAVAIFAQSFRSRLFVPLALLLGAIHFGLAGNAFTSIWPPHVLLMPFLCFFAAAATVGSGAGGFLPLLVLAACFLAHGHVAQAPFVVVLTLLAYGGLWRETRRGEAGATPWRRFPRPHAVAVVLLAVFLLPLAIDWAQWPHDNLALILDQLRGNSTDHKSVWKSFLYFLSFFSYRVDQDSFLPWHGPASPHFLREGILWYWGWLAAIGFVAWRWRALAPAEGGGPARAFLRRVAALWLATALLCLAWGVLQSGPMYAFNGYFYYAVLFVPLLLFAAALAAWLPDRGWLPAALWLVAGALLAASSGFAIQLPTTEESGIPLLKAAQAVLRADPRPHSPKILVFDHGDWPTVISVGLMLDRANIPFYVDPMLGSSRELFGQQHCLSALPDFGGAHPPSVWRFLRRAPAGVGVPLVDGLRVAFAPGRLDPDGGAISFEYGGNFEQFQLAGLTTPAEGPLFSEVSSTEPEAELDLSSPRAARDVVVTFLARPYLFPPEVRTQPMELWINGVPVGQAVLDRDIQSHPRSGPPASVWQTVAIRVPAAVWNRSPIVRLVMKFPHAISPTSLGINGDPRILAWHLLRLSLSYAL